MKKLVCMLFFVAAAVSLTSCKLFEMMARTNESAIALREEVKNLPNKVEVVEGDGVSQEGQQGIGEVTDDNVDQEGQQGIGEVTDDNVDQEGQQGIGEVHNISDLF